ncbi:GntR family transcriptional regulator [Devosia submarina]|uniref:GntR family transcriptional regulator n=1 Tax=Devosia submarina TaxID=1173082 RepID=UPI000D39B07E|nr:GntR family transcriptional regulator [Devosia submarina]
MTAKEVDDQTSESNRRLVFRIKQDIIANRYRAGEWLRLADLEQRYAASRNEVRKALAALATLRALEHVENYGYRLATYDADQARQNAEVRLVLETAAAAWIIERMRGEDIVTLREKAEKFAWSIEHADLGEIDLSNHDFHRALIALCGNATMAHMVNELRELALPSQYRPWTTVSGMRRSAEQHFAMIDALERRDLEGFLSVTTAHIRRWNDADDDRLARG